MIKMVKRALILSAGVGVGFGAGYLKAAADLDRETIQELAKIGKKFYAEVSEAIRQNVEEQRKQTEIFAATAEAMREATTKQTTEPGETP